eukprot:scaffold112117_cov31-Tisochrysis_lutea.AAC.1
MSWSVTAISLSECAGLFQSLNEALRGEAGGVAGGLLVGPGYELPPALFVSGLAPPLIKFSSGLALAAVSSLRKVAMWSFVFSHTDSGSPPSSILRAALCKSSLTVFSAPFSWIMLRSIDASYLRPGLYPGVSNVARTGR